MFPGVSASHRGQSNLVGLVIVLGLVVAGTTVIVVVGAGVLGDARADAQIDSAEHAMTKLDATASLVALGTSDTQRATVSLGGIGEELEVQPNRGWMNVTIVNATSDTVTQVVMKKQLGAIIYSHDKTEIAYQGGGVWKQTPTGTTMVSPPEFHYRGTTLTLPLVTVTGGPINDGDLVLRDANELQKMYPNNSAGLLNPITQDQINVSVTSDYYRAWGRFFKQRTSGDVYFDHANETVTIVLLVKTGTTSIRGGIVSGAAGTTLNVPNGAVVDSYNSSEGDYFATDQKNTSVIVAGNVLIENNALVKGNIVSGKDVTLENNAEVTGNISYEGAVFIDSSATVGGWTNDNATVPELASVGGLIGLKSSQFDSDAVNENDEEEDIDNSTDTLVSSNKWELQHGQYYLSEINLESGDELILNTTNGNISIVVQNDITMTNDPVIRVKGDGKVRFFLQNSIVMGQKANISVPNHNATQLWMYLKPSASATFGQSTRFVGVIYGPGPGTEPGVRINLGQKTKIFGGLVGDVHEVPNDVSIHFDEALVHSNPLAGQPDIPKVTYLHVTVNTINASTT